LKKRIKVNLFIFTIINSLICVLSNTYSYFSVLELFDFYNSDEYLNITLLVFNVLFISSIIITINSLIEEKVQVSKYILIRSNRKQTVYIYYISLIKEISLIVLTKIILDLILLLIFDKSNYDYFLYNSISLYISVILWLILFDCLSNLKIKNNILILFFISIIYISYMLLKYSDIFLLLIIRPYDDSVKFTKVILLKLIVILLILFLDIIIKSKKEYY